MCVKGQLASVSYGACVGGHCTVQASWCLMEAAAQQGTAAGIDPCSCVQRAKFASWVKYWQVAVSGTSGE